VESVPPWGEVKGEGKWEGEGEGEGKGNGEEEGQGGGKGGGKGEGMRTEAPPLALAANTPGDVAVARDGESPLVGAEAAVGYTVGVHRGLGAPPGRAFSSMRWRRVTKMQGKGRGEGGGELSEGDECGSRAGHGEGEGENERKGKERGRGGGY